MADGDIDWVSLGIAIALFIILIFVGSYIYLLIEGIAVEGSFLNAVYYVVLTVTTVGVGSYNPITAQGKVLTIVMVMIGMGLVLYIVTTVVKALLTRHIFIHQETTTSVSPTRYRKMKLSKRRRVR